MKRSRAQETFLKIILKDAFHFNVLSLVYLDNKDCKEKEEYKWNKNAVRETRFKEPRRADSSAEERLNERTLHSGHITWDPALQISNTGAYIYL